VTKHEFTLLAVYYLRDGILCGCWSVVEDSFRYPCQDPTNWNNAECKPPICTATGTCPEQLIKPEQEKK
jgi:hypothetical protein